LAKKKREIKVFGRTIRKASNPLNLPANTPQLNKEYIDKNQQVIIVPPFGQTMKAPSGKVVFANAIENKQKIDEYFEDPEIQKLMLVMLERTPQNIRWTYNNDNTIKSAVFILSQLIKGSSSIKVKSKNERLKKILTKYFKDIKIDTIIDRSLKDNVCFAESVWWLDFNTERNMIIPKKIDYINLTPIDNRFTGSKKWIQYVYVDQQLPEKDGRKWQNYDPHVDYTHISGFFPESPKDRLIKRHILEEDVLNFNFFDSAPMVGLVEISIWKKWMQYDAKLAGQKYATPLIKAAVELPTGYKLSEDETTDLLNKVAADLSALMNFGVLAYPKGTEIESINQQGQVFDFVRYLEYADKYTHKAILMPANLVDSTGSELATSRTTKDVISTTSAALGRMFLDGFHDLGMQQLEFIGMNVKEDEFELIFGEEDKQQRMTHSEEFNAIMNMWDRNLFKDANELRASLTKLGFDLEQFTDEELKLMKQEELLQQFISEGGGAGEENDELLLQIQSDIENQLGNE
jgi:hypothetical protein